jgi:hypothetical protein
MLSLQSVGKLYLKSGHGKAERRSVLTSSQLFGSLYEYFYFTVRLDCVWVPLGPAGARWGHYKLLPHLHMSGESVTFQRIYPAFQRAHLDIHAISALLSSGCHLCCAKMTGGLHPAVKTITESVLLLSIGKRLWRRRSGFGAGEGALITVPSQQDGAVTGPQ